MTLLHEWVWLHYSCSRKDNTRPWKGNIVQAGLRESCFKWCQRQPRKLPHHICNQLVVSLYHHPLTVIPSSLCFQYFILLLCIFLLEILAGVLAYIYYQQVIPIVSLKKRHPSCNAFWELYVWKWRRSRWQISQEWIFISDDKESNFKSDSG